MDERRSTHTQERRDEQVFIVDEVADPGRSDDRQAPAPRRQGRRGFLSPGTRAFVDEARRTPGYSFLEFLHGYVYARWPYLYIGIGTGESPLAKVVIPLIRLFSSIIPEARKMDLERETFAEGYHGKVMPTELAKKLVAVNEEVRLTELEQVIPYSRARDIVLKNPDHIVILECPCRSARSNPCTPLDVCMIIGEPFASFVSEHHPRRSRWINVNEAQEILESEHRRGHVHHAFFKDAMLGRFYAICNCCSCCCGAMQSMRSGTPMLTSSGYLNQVEVDLCIACGDCVEACPFDALSLGHAAAEVDDSECMGCGVCVSTCEQIALSLALEPSKGIPLEIGQLMERSLEKALG